MALAIGAARVRLRRPDDLAALRGRLPRRRLHGLLRRRVPVVPALARRPSQLVDGNSKLEISRSAAALAGPGLRRRPDRGTSPLRTRSSSTPSASSGRRASSRANRPRGERSRADGEAEHAPRARRGAPLPARPSDSGGPLALPSRCRTSSTHWRSRSSSSTRCAISTLSATVIGLALGIGNVGWLLGAVAANRLSARLGVGRTLVGSALVLRARPPARPAAPQSHPIPFLVACADPRVASPGSCSTSPASASSRRSRPIACSARLNATRRFIVWGVIPLGSLAGGALGLDHRAPVDALGGRDRRVALLPAPSALARPLDRPHGGRGPPTCARASPRATDA